MKILSLQAENIKRLIAVNITPDGNMVEITGRNGAGKTSVLDSIWWALGGTKPHQPEPIRRGEDEARIKLDLGDVIVRRTFTRLKPRKEGGEERVTTKITVENDKKARYQSPQRMLDDMLDSLSFDPLEFARMEPKAQYEEIKRLCGINLDGLIAEAQTLFDERTDVNREAKRKRAALDQAGTPPDNAPTEEVDVSALIVELTEIREANEAIGRDREMAQHKEINLNDSRRLLHEAEAVEETAEAALKAAMARHSEAAKTYKLQEKAFSLLPEPREPESTANVEQRIAAAGNQNAAYRARQEWRKLQLEAEEKEVEADKLTEQIDAKKAAAQKLIEDAKMPVEGLALVDGTVTFDGLPLEQASDAEQLRLSCAIAMHGNHDLRVIRVRDGSLLDSDALAVLAEMADTADYQVWIERVDETGTVGFVIEDGMVKGADNGTDDQGRAEGAGAGQPGDLLDG